MTENRNNAPKFTDDEACIAYDALQQYVAALREYVADATEADEEPNSGALRSIAAAEGAMDKLGHDR